MDVYGSPNTHGSRRFVSWCAWPRKNGVNEAAWYHRVNSSGPGSPKKPPTSAPAKERPARLMDSSMGAAIFRCPHSAALSPVHIAPKR
jgi:hypothetical protein